MSVNIAQGLCRLYTVVATLNNGQPYAGTDLLGNSNQAASVRARVNPADNRQIGVLALEVTTGATVVVANPANTVRSPDLIVSVTAPSLQSITLQAASPDVDVPPPAWLTA